MTLDPEALHQLDPALLARYLSGEAGRDERAQVERWIAASPDNRALVERMRAVWDYSPAVMFDPDDTVWQRLHATITTSHQRPELVRVRQTARTHPLQRTHVSRQRWVAAAIAVLAIGGTLTVRWGLSGAASREIAVPPVAREITTRRGERLALRLADGTRVVLAPESRLRLADGGDARRQGTRDVQLDGEALFTVVHDSARPFRVHTANAIAEDLGTEFVVTNYPETQGTRVVVASGLVELQRREPGGTGPAAVRLQQGDLGVISPERSVIREHGVDVRPYTSWADGTLVFDGTPLRDAIPMLRRWYGADIQLGRPELAEMKLTATFRDESVTQAMALIAMSLSLTNERHGTTITLR